MRDVPRADSFAPEVDSAIARRSDITPACWIDDPFLGSAGPALPFLLIKYRAAIERERERERRRAITLQVRVVIIYNEGVTCDIFFVIAGTMRVVAPL